MSRATTGLRRLRADLPPGTPVADKTGSGGARFATNDVGLITLPGGKGHLAMAVFVTRSPLTEREQEKVIAEMGQAAYEGFASGVEASGR
jgi:beta-lactamase class A